MLHTKRQDPAWWFVQGDGALQAAVCGKSPPGRCRCAQHAAIVLHHFGASAALGGLCRADEEPLMSTRPSYVSGLQISGRGAGG